MLDIFDLQIKFEYYVFFYLMKLKYIWFYKFWKKCIGLGIKCLLNNILVVFIIFVQCYSVKIIYFIYIIERDIF